jgi:subtilisin family serine protease
MFVRSVLTAGLAAVAAVTGLSGAASAATPDALPTGTIVAAPGAEAIRDSYIVVLKPGSDAAGHVTSASQALAKRYGGEVRNNYLATVRGFQAGMSATEAAHLAADPSVAYVQQDAKVSIDATQTGATWGIDRLDQKVLPLSTTYTYGTASNVTAYVLDTGIRISHTDFGGRATYGWNFIDGNADASDCNGHGTHVAGTIGGRTYGVTKDVKLVAVKVLDCTGSGSYSAIMAGVDWVTAHAVKPAVANMSLGGPVYQALNDAVTRSIASGVTYAVAAGNDNKNACQQSPAVTPNAITVGATDNADTRASFSNYGTCVDLFAPGSRITSDSNSSNTATKMMSGTSMASPHVAGAAALYLATHTTATPAQVRDALVSGATPAIVSSAGAGTPTRLLNAGAGTSLLGGIIRTVQSTLAIAIPDTGAYVYSPLTISSVTGNAPASLAVNVDITHAFRGDLVIDLIAPDGSVYPLKNYNAADGYAFTPTTYTVNASSENASGTWNLRVRDVYAKNAGRINHWSLTF